MCIVVPGYNNNARFRLEYNLNSIFSQNYTNYFVVIMNDASTDGSDELFRKYLHFYNIKKENYVYVENYKRRTALENIYMATHYYCSEDSVIVNMDGDDEFIGKNVLKVFNAGYQRHKAGVVYSNFYWYEQGVNIMLGFTS
jgi:glycosyltransferase involved in cell wall biosynthesis